MRQYWISSSGAVIFWSWLIAPGVAAMLTLGGAGVLSAFGQNAGTGTLAGFLALPVIGGCYAIGLPLVVIHTITLLILQWIRRLTLVTAIASAVLWVTAAFLIVFRGNLDALLAPEQIAPQLWAFSILGLVAAWLYCRAAKHIHADDTPEPVDPGPPRVEPRV